MENKNLENMKREEILEKIRKIQALVDRGVGGEKVSAEKRLAEMMAKYNITEQDLETSEEQIFWFKASGHDWEMVFKQTAFRLGVTRFALLRPGDQSKKACELRMATQGSRPRGTNVVMICTYSKFLEVTTAYGLYQKSFDDHYEAFVYAFLSKNDLLGKGSDDHKLTDKEREMLMRAYGMMGGIDKVEHYKQLGSGNYLEE